MIEWLRKNFRFKSHQLDPTIHAKKVALPKPDSQRQPVAPLPVIRELPAQTPVSKAEFPSKEIQNLQETINKLVQQVEILNKNYLEIANIIESRFPEKSFPNSTEQSPYPLVHDHSLTPSLAIPSKVSPIGSDRLLSLFDESFSSENPRKTLLVSLREAGLDLRNLRTSDNPLDTGWHECQIDEGTVVLIKTPATGNGWAMPLPGTIIEAGDTGRLFNFTGSMRATKRSIRTLPVLSLGPTGSWTIDQVGTLAQG